MIIFIINASKYNSVLDKIEDSKFANLFKTSLTINKQNCSIDKSSVDNSKICTTFIIE